jgi:hypothetical protein
MSNSDFTKLRKEQLLLIRIALEDFYHSQCRNDDSCDTAYYKDLNRNLVKVNGNRLQFISTTKTIAGGAKELKRLLDQYVKKQIENGNLKEKENYPSIKIKSPTPIDSKKSKSGSQIVDVFSTDTIEDILKVAAYVNLIEKPTSVGLNFIFMDFDKSRNPEQTIEHLQEKWVLDTKSLSLKKNKKYEIPVDFMTLIEYHTQHFIERKTVISKFETFIQTRKHGYFILKGEPGVGKTALLAHYAKEYNHPCYFIRKAQGINRFEDFIDSICEQMCFKYYEKLGYLENELGSISVRR